MRSKSSARDLGFKVGLRPQVESYLEILKTHAPKQARKCADGLAELGSAPFRKRPRADIRKWRGPEYDYRLRVRRHRFGYDVLKNDKFVDVKRAWFK